MNAPIAASETWTQVMDRAGHRCQCTWRRHPAHRGEQDGRCERTTSGTQLSAGPLDPGPHPDRTIAAVPAEEMRAWCPPCWDEAAKVARRQDREAERIARWNGQMAALFDPAT